MMSYNLTNIHVVHHNSSDISIYDGERPLCLIDNYRSEGEAERIADLIAFLLGTVVFEDVASDLYDEPIDQEEWKRATQNR